MKHPLESIWLVRHPPVSAGQGLCYGRTDVSVDDAAQRSALASVTQWLDSVGQSAGDATAALVGGESGSESGSLFGDVKPAAPGHPGLRVWSSPLLRCRQLALAVQLARPDRVRSLHADARLQELDFAAWEWRAWDAIDRQDIDAWAADPWHYRPGGGESAHDVLTRWQSFRRMVLDPVREDDCTMDLIFTHAGVIRMALFDAGQLKESDLWLHAVPYAQPVQLK